MPNRSNSRRQYLRWRQAETQKKIKKIRTEAEPSGSKDAKEDIQMEIDEPIQDVIKDEVKVEEAEEVENQDKQFNIDINDDSAQGVIQEETQVEEAGKVPESRIDIKDEETSLPKDEDQSEKQRGCLSFCLGKRR
ncbi:hypothetical protein L2E82_25795 [Cichorium intybus]|uniref:Uncharacterized protein n=1 Tax=Cichorium intybus TaxID=13427 RepID=A0ACB9E467_CICIN|nr:hypothetical protein L2E82_25795 [Cichorium intybus]